MDGSRSRLSSLQARRPDAGTAAVHPYRAESGAACRGHVQQRLIAHVEDFLRRAAQRACELLETAPLGLGGADLARIQRHREQGAESDALEVGVAVAEARELIAQAAECEDVLRSAAKIKSCS